MEGPYAVSYRSPTSDRLMKIRLLAMIAAAAVTTGCSGISTSHDFDPNFAFAEARTWDWMPAPPVRRGDTRTENRFVNERIRAAIELAMEEKGMQKVDGDPDLRVGYHLALDDAVSYETMNSYYGPGWGYGMYRYPYGPTMTTSTTRERRYTVGTLIIDVFDVASQELVWRGTGEGEVHQASDPEERQRRADEAVWQVMSSFPPGE
ncbi:MAG: hypothetical protein AMS19_10890 [Gemmatimonas sp. SG8_23]|nr:MAG: hypothetical protein AMS19_10890 [Gemmatimonas sp. SG8_23]